MLTSVINGHITLRLPCNLWFGAMHTSPPLLLYISFISICWNFKSQQEGWREVSWFSAHQHILERVRRQVLQFTWLGPPVFSLICTHRAVHRSVHHCYSIWIQSKLLHRTLRTSLARSWRRAEALSGPWLFSSSIPSPDRLILTWKTIFWYKTVISISLARTEQSGRNILLSSNLRYRHLYPHVYLRLPSNIPRSRTPRS